MVFEGPLATLLNKLAGSYIENLDANQLNMGIWGGNIEFKDLSIKTSVLDNLDLPVQVVSGQIGRLALKIPWHSLYNSEILISVEDIYLVVEPNTQVQYDPIREEKNTYEAKKNEIMMVELAKQAEADKDKPTANLNMMEKFVMQMVKNIRLSIKNIHIRYEDKVTRPGHPFAVGITLSDLEIVSTNDKWEPAISREEVTKIFKIVELECLGVYWNTDAVLYANLSAEDLKLKLRNGIASKSNPTTNRFILGPINASARVKMSQRPELDKPPYCEPSAQINLNMEKLFVGVTKSQYFDIIGLAESMDRMMKGKEYRKYRPALQSYKGHYKEWWQFAYTCILENEVRRKRKNWNWEHMKNHRSLCHEYGNLYKKKLQNTAGNAEKTRLEECEKLLDLTNIVIIRQRAELEVERINRETKSKSSWTSWLWRSGGSKEEKKSNEILDMFKDAMSAEEKEKLYKAIGYQDNAAPAMFPENFIQYSLVFVLQTLEVGLTDDVSNVLLTELKGVKCKAETRPAGSAIRLHVKIDNFMTTGVQQDDFLPQLISSDLENNDGLLEVNFETNPINTNYDQRIYVTAQPLRIVYDAQTILKIIDIFKVPESSTLEDLAAAAGNKITDMKEKTALGLQYAIDKHVQIDLKLDFKAPYVIIPYGGKFTGNENVLIVNLGHIKMYSLDRKYSKTDITRMHNEGLTRDEILNNIKQQSYDQFKLELTQIQIMIAQSDEDWRSCLSTVQRCDIHLLYPVSLNLTFAKSLITDDPRLPLHKFSGQLPAVDIQVSDSRILLLFALITSIPLPNSEENVEEIPVLRKASSLGSVTALNKYFDVKSSSTKPKGVKPVDDREVVQFTTFQADFEMSEFSLGLYSQENLEAKKEELVSFKLKSLKCGLAQKTFSTTVTATLDSISLQQNRNGKIIDIVTNRSDEEGKGEALFKVVFIMVNPKSPELHSVHKSCEQLLKLDFGTLAVTLHQEGLLSLIAFAKNLQELLNDSQAPIKKRIPSYGSTSSLRSKTKLSLISEEVVKPRKKKIVVETIKFKLQAVLQEVTLCFETDSGKVSSMGIKGINSDIILKESYTHIVSKLETISVIDLNPETIHNTIVGSLGNETITAEVVLHNLENEESDRPDISVTLKMGTVKICFLNWYISNMLKFLNNFQAAQEKIVEASQAAAQSAKENMKDAYEKATKIALNIQLKAPIISVPVSSKSLEVIVIDLGQISLINRFITLGVKFEDKHSAIIDELTANLTDLKITRMLLNEKKEPLQECNILEPLDFSVTIKRNLSSSWYKEVAEIFILFNINTFNILLASSDYKMLMDILSGNLAEGKEEIPEANIQTVTDTVSKEEIVTATEVHESQEVVTEFLKFVFFLNKINVSLYRDASDANFARAPSNGLASLSLEGLSLKGRILSDQSMVASFLLSNFLLIDIREGRETKLNRVIERSQGDGLAITEDGDAKPKSMIDVTFQKKNEDMFADVRIFSITLMVSLDYLLKLADFFKLPSEEAKPPEKNVVSTKSQMKIKANAEPVATPSQSQLTINFKMEKPDIILVEHMDNIDANAIVLNNEVLVKVRIQGDHQVINGTIKDLSLYTCSYNPAKRALTRKDILHPVTISLAGSTPADKGLHVELLMTNMHLSVSPAIIELITCVLNTATAKDDGKDGDSEQLFQHTTLWDVKPFKDTDYWFLKTDVGEEVTEATMNDTTTKKVLQELCLITIPSISITLEAGVGKKTLPMILLDTSLKGQVTNWSSFMSMEASLTLEMGYYNSRLALWEPLIEPVTLIDKGKKTYVPWELKLELSMNEPDDILSSSSAEDIQNLEAQKSVMSIDVKSENNLELTVTKTCLEVLTNLGNAFATAMKTETTTKIESIIDAPFKVVNETGLNITLMLTDSPFRVTGDEIVNEVLLESSAHVPLQFDTDIKGENRTLKLTQEFLDPEHSKKDYLLNVKINDKNCDLTLPVLRAEKRFFMLNYRGDSHDNWGIISHVKVEDGVTVITLRSILQVYNHFSVAVDVYYMTEKGNEAKLISAIKPGGVLNIPLSAVYTPTNELFFSVNDYSVTAMPYIWKDLQTNLTITKLLQCTPIKDDIGSEPFIIKAVGEMEQVYYENTTRHTMASTCYNIHLRPAVMLSNCLPVDIIFCIEERMEDLPIPAGDTIQLPNVDPEKTVVVIKIPEYLEKEWTCRYELTEKADEFSVWSFNSYDSEVKVTLDLGMHFINKNGSLKLALYCPFWMLNKTGLMLGYRKSKKLPKHEEGSPAKNTDDNANILYHPPDFKGPILFSFNAKNFFGKKKASVCVEQGKWSDKFSLDVAGSSGVVVCKSSDRIYQIGVHNQLTYNGLTKQITFTPYYVLMNNAPFVIECQEFDRSADPWIKIQPKSCSALWPRSSFEDKCLKLRVEGANELSEPFLYTESHTTLLKLKNEYGGINVDIQLTEGGIYINFAEYEHGMAPALILNHTDEQIEFWEKEHVQRWILNPKTCVLHTWLNPSGPRMLVWEKDNKKEIENDLRKDGVGEFSLQEKSYYWASFLDGMQRILLFTDDKTIAESAQASNLYELIQQDITVSIQGVGLSIVNNFNRQDIMYLGIASSGVIWEQCKLSSQRYKQLTQKESVSLENAYQHYQQKLLTDSVTEDRVVVDNKTEVDFKINQMFKPNKRKIRRSFQTGLWINLKSSPSQMQLHAKINRIQIDNQMYDCIFPVVLAPVPPPKSVASDSGIKPFVELSIVQLLMKNSQIKQYKYFKVLVQEFHIKVELGFVNALMGLFETSDQTEEHEKQLFLTDMQLVNEPLYSHASLQSLQEQKSFYDLLHFSPLKIHVSFSMAEGSTAGLNTSTDNFIKVLLQGVGVTLTDMQDVVFKLAYFQREYTFLTRKTLISEATRHYVGQSIKQLYVLVLGLDVIGNPYGLVLGISKGVEDLFYEPFQGAIQGPGEFAEGLALGVRSLFGHTVGGAAGAVSRITGAMGKGLAVLTFDKDYQRKRRDQLNKKPTSAQEGFARSGKGLVMGVVDGVTGVFTKPVTGAKEEGVEGFFKGLGKGAIGLVARPTAGIVDFASSSLDVVKRATELGEDTSRLRPPRFLQQDGLVKPYNQTEADGQKLLMELEKGKYAVTDIYVHYYELTPKKEYVLLTDKRLAIISHNDIFGGWQIDWACTWQDIKNPAKILPKGVSITTSGGKKKLFKSNENTKLIPILDPGLKDELYTKIESLRGSV